MVRKLGIVLLALVSLPALCVIGFGVAGVLLRPGFEPVDLSDPPNYLAFLGAWRREDGSVGCRLFYHRDLVRHADSIPPLRFRLSESDMSVCLASVASFRSTGRWPDSFPWEVEGTWATAVRPDPSNPYRYEVTYSPDESLAITRYEVAEGGQPTAILHNPGTGPGTGIGIVFFGGAGGIIAWLGILLWFALDHLRGHRAGPAAGGAAR